MIAVVMGVSGVGKTTIGKALAAELRWRFLDGDDFHPPQNVAKMAAGLPLDDADRWPWLGEINKELLRLEKQHESAVLACSALKEAYRKRLTADLARFEIVFLHGAFDLIRERLARRRHRYMPATLLESQFAALEPPAGAIEIDVAAPVEACVAAIISHLRAQ